MKHHELHFFSSFWQHTASKTRAVHRSNSPNKSDSNHPIRRQYGRFRALVRSAAVQIFEISTGVGQVSVLINKKLLNPTRPNYFYTVDMNLSRFIYNTNFQRRPLPSQEPFCLPKVIFPRNDLYPLFSKTYTYILRITLNLLYYQYNF